MINSSFPSLVPPQINHFSFGEESIPEGETASVQCVVQKGDLPIEIIWSHNGYLLDDQFGVNIAQMSPRISFLNIDSVKAKHRGNFTCQATNQAGQDKYTSELHIDGISMLRVTVNVCYYFISYFSIQNKRNLLHCLIQSYPIQSSVSIS